MYDPWQSAIDAYLNLVQKALEINLYGPWLLCPVFVPLMKRNGYGRIVNVSSGAGSLNYMQSTSEKPVYEISKSTHNALAIKLASELSRMNILVNAVNSYVNNMLDNLVN